MYICARACDDVWGSTHCRGQRQRYTTSCPHQQHIQAKMGSNTKYILFSVSLQFELLHLWLLHATRFFCAAAFSPTFILCFILISSLTVCIFLHGMFWIFFLVYSVLGICFARQVAFSKKLFFLSFKTYFELSTLHSITESRFLHTPASTTVYLRECVSVLHRLNGHSDSVTTSNNQKNTTGFKKEMLAQSWELWRRQRTSSAKKQHE